MTRPELLAAVQDWKSLEIISDIADAIYFGIKNYNMRIKANNFDRKDLEKVVEYCRAQSPPLKCYLTTNILIYDSELQDLENLIIEAKDAGIDAIIAHDFAAIQIAKRVNINFHVSTQANVSNIEAAKFYEENGAERIILARELSLKQIRLIKHLLTKTKIECFVHGSMCTSISGRCYLSATVCDSEEYSANRGNCIQPCRREWRVIDDRNNEFIYDGQMFLNAKDLCMIEYIPELIEAKIDAFKIEGRMRDPLYINEVSACYREAIDAYYDKIFTLEKVQTWLKRLKKVYNRGFSTGFYFGVPKGSEIEKDVEGNVSDYRKIEIGKVLSYYPEKKAAKILLTSGKLKLDDEIFFLGTHTDTFLRQRISSIQIKQKKNLTETSLVTNKNNRISVGIIVDKPVKKNDKIFKIKHRKK